MWISAGTFKKLIMQHKLIEQKQTEKLLMQLKLLLFEDLQQNQKKINEQLYSYRFENEMWEERDKENPLGIADDGSFSSETIRSDLRAKRRVVRSH